MHIYSLGSATMAPSPDSFVLRQQQPPLSPLDTDLLALSFKSVSLQRSNNNECELLRSVAGFGRRPSLY
ncbi:hypothetical protein HF086_016170 [Spodoptera exigua]|uniref:Uncharacterized protein n=1 Tax=Spodoptera exigua TaxID=7107 RepID=A0A922MI68_SPOEX|nr:hypothetical protein HF086_016170 [Spodoptera exigua]